MRATTDDLIHTLVGNAKLPREISLRLAFSMAGADHVIALLDGEGLTQRGIVVDDSKGSTREAPAIF